MTCPAVAIITRNAPSIFRVRDQGGFVRSPTVVAFDGGGGEEEMHWWQVEVAKLVCFKAFLLNL